MIDKNAFARFVLCNDFNKNIALTNDEIYFVESRFYNKDLSTLDEMPLWKLVDVIGDTKLAEKIYTAFKNFDESVFDKLKNLNISILTNSNPFYPKRIAKKLKNDAPILFYCLGDITILNENSTAAIGARKIDKKGKKFAKDIGELIAKQNSILISGGAKGSDYLATKSVINNGGKAIWFVAVSAQEIIQNKEVKEWIDQNQLLVCFDFNPFSKFESKIALRRNKYIYANCETAFVCQCNSKISGTFSGANYCLKHNLCELFVFDNETDAAKTLIENGAIAIYDK